MMYSTNKQPDDIRDREKQERLSSQDDWLNLSVRPEERRQFPDKTGTYGGLAAYSSPFAELRQPSIGLPDRISSAFPERTGIRLSPFPKMEQAVGANSYIIEGGILEGIAKDTEAPGYVGEEGFYVLLSSLRRTSLSKIDGTLQELTLNIEKIVPGEEEPHHSHSRYTMLLRARSHDCFGEDEKLLKIRLLENLSRQPGFEGEAEQDCAFRNEEMNLVIRLQATPGTPWLVIDVIEPVDSLEDLTERIVPAAARVLSEVLPGTRISEQVVRQCGRVAHRSRLLDL